MFHLFGNILTGYGAAANNHSETEGNVAQLQKIFWKNEVHTTVSAEALRWSLRYYWQQLGLPVNRQWNDNEQNYKLINNDYDALAFIDDDVLGFMRAEAAKIDSSDQEDKQSTRKSRNKPKGTRIARRGALDVSRAVSSLRFFGETTFSAKSGERSRTSLYSTEFHATRYQYGFALTPDHLEVKSRVLAVLDGFVALSRVGGNHGRFLYDFSPEVVVLRWTHDFAPRILYCFEEDEQCNISVPALIQKISSGDLKSEDLWIGGCNLGGSLQEWGVHIFPGVHDAVEAVKARIAQDLQV
ncbi:type I-B CRISPR-associated protein Cas7/Cst2/DevR [Leptolyngbya sp. PL-A3]|uniref:type I-B CRISPR-associated protein Cas7/Cst2/DevR n=1 Tax=Leptolyngbya sp. PL-A3 TaxID=2933911 RepID=UPI0018EFA137